MNVISWENGDSQITDLPACADPMLARVVQAVNDTYCAHRDEDLLCPSCSVDVLALAHRTAGTGATGLSDIQLRQVWVTLAAEQARSVLHLIPPPEAEPAVAAVEAAERWAAEPTEENRAATAATYAGYAGYAAAYAGYAAYAATTADTAAYAAYAATTAAYAAGGGLARAHGLIDRFLELTGASEAHIPQETTAKAVEKMLAVTR